ncbi:MAG: hypothetical protein J6U77_05575 [Verrucomicrobia bacterium]|nr:hypothetical protein [Verrucomicrobiota bacterium]
MIQANASELEPNRIPKDSRFLLHVDVQKAIQSQNGKTFERLWINPLLEGYGGNISPSVDWNSSVIGGITFFGKGVYTNFQDQVFIFKPLSTNWLVKLRKELKITQPPGQSVRFSKGEYKVVLTPKVIYVSRNAQHLNDALKGSGGEVSLLKRVKFPKDSYLDIVMDEQFREMLDLPFADSLTKDVKRLCFSLSEPKQCLVDMNFDLKASADPKTFAKQTSRTLRWLSFTDPSWGEILKSARVDSSEQCVMVQGQIESTGNEVSPAYYSLLEILFGVSDKEH